MSDFLLRDLDPVVLDALRRRAESEGRSLQAEIHAVLRANTVVTREREAFAARAARFVAETRGRGIPDVTESLRRDRDRDHGCR